MPITTLDGVVAGMQIPKPIIKTGITTAAVVGKHLYAQSGRHTEHDDPPEPEEWIVTLKEILELVKLGRELGSVILEIARALKGEDNEEAARLARSHGQASGRAAYEASRNAGPAVRRVK